MSAARPPSAAGPPRPGPLAWTLIVAGTATMLWAVIGVFVEADQSNPRNWLGWVLGAALVHDLVLLPCVLAVGAAIVFVPGRAKRAWLRWGLAVASVITLATFPVAMRWGASPTDPSELPLPVARNLAVMWAVVVPGALIVGALVDRRREGTHR